MGDDDHAQDARDTVARLKRAGDALDAATKASKQTAKEVGRAKRAVAAAKKTVRVLSVTRKRQPARKRRPKTST